ncbi:MAG: hypothetical protein Solumvirus6_13 [Solumvirus sp.]|uniref:Uncharacterized protein n=1 Tax=Solumvirus sp. TaxID=2487773 RepID=A0A3G5AGX6_9VIRU|nr:MAG: hypothetical protein Solumvirus6_13 [Solumvirus sp.]
MDLLYVILIFALIILVIIIFVYKASSVNNLSSRRTPDVKSENQVQISRAMDSILSGNVVDAADVKSGAGNPSFSYQIPINPPYNTSFNRPFLPVGSGPSRLQTINNAPVIINSVATSIPKMLGGMGPLSLPFPIANIPQQSISQVIPPQVIPLQSTVQALPLQTISQVIPPQVVSLQPTAQTLPPQQPTIVEIKDEPQNIIVASDKSDVAVSEATGCSRSVDFRSASTPIIQRPERKYQPVKVSTPIKINRRTNHKPNSIIDACSFADATLKLFGNGKILRIIDSSRSEKGKNDELEITNFSITRENLLITHIRSAGGHLYSISNKNLYILDMSSYDKKKWLWKKCSWAPSGIIDMGVTHDEKHLWLHRFIEKSVKDDLDGNVGNFGYLYDTSEDEKILGVSTRSPKIYQLPEKVKRVYGNDAETYIDIEHDTCIARLHNGENITIYDQVCEAVLDHNNLVIPIKPKELGKYSGVRLINWEPLYIKS